jgi:hypothetical protein
MASMSTTGFGAQEVTNRQQQLSLNGSLPLSLLNNELTIANTGAVVDTASEYRVRHQSDGVITIAAKSINGSSVEIDMIGTVIESW